jgi:ribosomal protein S18 acetylase RimI-like enzyme
MTVDNQAVYRAWRIKKEGGIVSIDIRSASPDDAPFLAWVMLAATRSHLNYGVWEYYVGGTEQDCLSFLSLIATTQKSHLFHYSTFIVAEANGQKVGALSGYDPKVLGMKAFTQALPEVFQQLGWTRDQQKAAFERYLPWMTCMPDDAEGAWIVESVAALPQYRRQGVVSRLLDEVLERGRSSGYRRAQIGVLINNTPARRAYEKSGFKFDSEKRDQNFEAIFGTPGITKLLLDL